MEPGEVQAARNALREPPEPLFASVQSRRLRRVALRWADRLLANGWRPPGGGRETPLQVPFPWQGIEGREAQRRAHAFEPLDSLLEAHSWSRRPGYLLPAAAIAADWARHGCSEEVAGEPGVTGNRAYRLGYLVRAAAAEPGIDDDDLRVLLAAAAADAETLAAHRGIDGALAGACGLLSLTGHLGGVVASVGRLREQACDRAERDFRVRFSSDGIHLSHSPAHHEGVLTMLASLLDSGLAVGAPRLEELRSQAEEALAWMTLPDGTVVDFGDTPAAFVSPVWHPQRTAAHLVRDRYIRAAMIHAATAGAMGDAPDGRVRGFPEGGLAVVKSGWPRSPADRADSTYVAFQAGFHSALHKHADDLSLVWFDRGRHILVDSGFAPPAPAPSGDSDDASAPSDDGGEEGALDLLMDPEAGAGFIRTARAHNTIEIDGLDHDLDRKPYGSGLRKWGEIGTVAFVEGRSQHGPVIHTRSVAVSPGSWLLVLDDLSDEEGSSHSFRQWFQVAEGLQVSSRGSRVLMAAEGSPHAWVTPLLPWMDLIYPARGRSSPQIRGWRAVRPGRFVPIWTFGYEGEGATAAFATLFTLEGPAGRIRVDGDGIGWRHPGGRVTVSIQSGAILDIELEA